MRSFEGVQLIRITGMAGREGMKTIHDLMELTEDEIVTAIQNLCDYATQLEHEVDHLKGQLKKIAKENFRGTDFNRPVFLKFN